MFQTVNVGYTCNANGDKIVRVKLYHKTVQIHNNQQKATSYANVHIQI